MSEENEFDAILDEKESAEPEVAEPVIETVTEPEPEAKEAAEPEGETTTPEKESWTLSAVMDEREKRQKAVNEATELREKLAAFEKPAEDISVFEDEPGFREQLKNESAEAIRNNSLNMSQAFAEEVYGEEKVAKAVEWFKNEGVKSPYTINKFNSAKLPFHAAVKMFDEEQARVDPDAYKAKLKAEILAELKTENTPEATPEPVTPSLASSRSAGKAASNSTESWDDILGA